MKMFDILRRGAAIAGDGTAVVHGERTISYSGLLQRAVESARFLNSHGVGAGDRIGILSDNSIEYISFLFAVYRADGIAVPLDNSQTADKLADVLADCGASAIYVQSKFLRHLGTILARNERLQIVVSDATSPLEIEGRPLLLLKEMTDTESGKFDLEAELSGIDETVRLEGLTYDSRPDISTSPTAIFYTSGSTGAGKGVMLSHRNLIANTIGTVDYLKLTASDSILVVLPFYYIYGNSLLLTHILVGGTLILDNRFAFPQAVLNTMKESGATGFSGVPSNFMILLNNAEFRSESFPKLRYLTQAGGGLSPDLIKQVAERFHDKELYIMYGQTEAAPRVSWLPPERLADKLGSVGIPVPGVTFRIIDEDGREVPPGEIGELTVAGDNIMLGYYGHGEEEALTLIDGWLYTGDLGYVDDEGFLYIKSRKKEIIKVGGFRVSAREVEECILQDSRVLEAAVIGVPDPILGEALKAIVALKPGEKATEKEIKDNCQVKLSMRKTPSHVEFIDSMPKLQSGKIDRHQLKKNHR